MAATLNQAQLQILDMMSFIKSEETLKELKQILNLVLLKEVMLG